MIVTIASFRGAWYLLDTHWLPATPLASELSGLVLGAATLAALRMISCLHAGVFSDKPRWPHHRHYIIDK